MAKKKTISIPKEVQAQFFSDDVLVSKDKAKEILDIIYDMGLDARDLSYVISRIREYIVHNMLADIIQEMDQDKIKDLITQISVEILNPEVAINDSCGDQEAYTANADVAWFFSAFQEHKTYGAGDMVEVQIMRIGKRNHPSYGEIEVTADTLVDVKKNFEENKRGIELAVDENHEDDHKALAWYKELFIIGDGLYAKLELTKAWADLLTQWAYKYFSPEIIMKKVDEESGEVITNLLIGGAFTNRPFFKMMDPIKANESSEASNQQQAKGNETTNHIYLYNANKHMNKFLKLAKQFGAKEVITKDELAEVQAVFAELSDDEKANIKTKAVYESVCAKFNEEETTEEAAAETVEETKVDESTEEAATTEETEEAKEDETVAADGETVAATEAKDTVVVKANEYEALKAMQTDHNRLLHEAKVTATKQKVAGFAFNETTKKGVLLPKHTDAVVEFAAGLSDAMQAKFFAILENVQTTKFSVLAKGELGGGTTETADKNDLANKKIKELVADGMKYNEAQRKVYKELNISSDDEDTDEVK